MPRKSLGKGLGWRPAGCRTPVSFVSFVVGAFLLACCLSLPTALFAQQEGGKIEKFYAGEVKCDVTCTPAENCQITALSRASTITTTTSGTVCSGAYRCSSGAEDKGGARLTLTFGGRVEGPDLIDIQTTSKTVQVCTGKASCGDGIVQKKEQCDDGNEDDLDGCSNKCKKARCGDKVKQAGEDCEKAADCGRGKECKKCQCQGRGGVKSVCGDGVTDDDESCDDGNTVSGDGCDSDCNLEGCPAGYREDSPCKTGECETDKKVIKGTEGKTKTCYRCEKPTVSRCCTSTGVAWDASGPNDLDFVNCSAGGGCVKKEREHCLLTCPPGGELIGDDIVLKYCCKYSTLENSCTVDTCDEATETCTMCRDATQAEICATGNKKFAVACDCNTKICEGGETFSTSVCQPIT